NAGCAGHTDDSSSAFLVTISLQRIDPARIKNSASRVAESHHFCFLLEKDTGHRGPHIAKTLYRHAGPAQGDLFQLAHFLESEEKTPRRCVGAAFRTAQGNGLAGDRPQCG